MKKFGPKKEKQLILKTIEKQETLKLIPPIVIIKKIEEERKDLPGQIIMKEQK